MQKIETLPLKLVPIPDEVGRYYLVATVEIDGVTEDVTITAVNQILARRLGLQIPERTTVMKFSLTDSEIAEIRDGVVPVTVERQLVDRVRAVDVGVVEPTVEPVVDPIEPVGPVVTVDPTTPLDPKKP